jgi:adenylate cyclase
LPGSPSIDAAANRASAEALARRAVALDPNDAEARTRLGQTLIQLGDYAGALAETEAALAISPNLASAHAVRGAILMWSGHPNEGRLAINNSLRLDPHDPMLNLHMLNVVISYYLSGEYEAAVEAARSVIRAFPDYPNLYRWLAAALGQIGVAEAKEALEKAIAIAPAAFDMFVRRRVPWHRPEDHAHMLEGLRKAGWEG